MILYIVCVQFLIVDYEGRFKVVEYGSIGYVPITVVDILVEHYINNLHYILFCMVCLTRHSELQFKRNQPLRLKHGILWGLTKP